MTSVAAVEVAASIAMRIVAVEAMVVVATEDTVAVTTTTTVDHQDTKTETTAPMDDVMTMGPAASIAMLRVAVMIATAAAEMTVVVAAAAVAVTIEAMVVTVTQLLGSLVTHMEVEPPMIALTIGTPVVKLRSAKIHRYGALCKINAPRPTQPYGLALDQNCW